MKNEFSKAMGQFLSQYDPTSGRKLTWDGPFRVVLSNRYKEMDDETVLCEVIRLLDESPDYEVIFIGKEGDVYDLRKLRRRQKEKR